MAIYTAVLTVITSSPPVTLTVTFEAIDTNTDNFITFDELVPSSTFTLAWDNPSILDPPTFTVSSVLEDFVFDEPYFLFDIVLNKFGSGLTSGLFVEFFGIQTNPGFWYLHDDGDITGGCLVTNPCLETSYNDTTIKYPVEYPDIEPITEFFTTFILDIDFSVYQYPVTEFFENISIGVKVSPLPKVITNPPSYLKVTNVEAKPYLVIDFSTKRI